MHDGGADLVGDVGDDLEADPEPAVARHLEAVAAEVEDLLHGAGEQRRKERVVEGDLGVRRQRGGLRERVVAGEREHAAPAADAGVVRVLEDVAGAIDAGPLAVPHPEHAVVLRPREHVGQLSAVDRGGAEVLVEAGDEDDVVLGEQLRVALEREIEAPERRAAVARDQRRRAHAAPRVGAVLIEGQEGLTWERWRRLARAAEDGGFEALFRSDHLTGLFGDPKRPSLDTWASLTWLASNTSRIRFGPLVCPLTFHHGPARQARS